MSLDRERLRAAAREAARASYSPYSHFRVGAALLASDGTVITGTNVENRSYGLTICAERSALAQLVSRGLRSFAAVAVHTPDSGEPVTPCGACRQVLSEFASPETPVLCEGGSGAMETTLGALFPFDSLQELKDR